MRSNGFINKLQPRFEAICERLQEIDNETQKKLWGEVVLKDSEDEDMYSMSVSKFMQLAKDAKACYKVNQLVLVNLDIIDEYLETFHIVDDEFYK